MRHLSTIYFHNLSHKAFLGLLVLLLSNLFSPNVQSHFNKTHELEAALADDANFFKIDLYAKKGELSKFEDVQPNGVILESSTRPEHKVSHLKVAGNWNPNLINRLPFLILIVGNLSPPISSLVF